MNFQKFSLREPMGGNPPDPHSQNHTTPLFSIHLRISRELTPPGVRQTLVPHLFLNDA